MKEFFEIKEGILEAYTGREEKVVIPQEVHTIGEGAFKACVSLKRVVMPVGLKRIMDGAFKGCRMLEEAEIPEGVTYIGAYGFHRCHSLKRVVLPPSVKELGDCVFLYCDSLTEVKIPGVRRLGRQVFVNDVCIEKLEISQDLESDCICEVFTGCSRLKEIAFAGGECWHMPNVVEVTAGEMQVPPLVRIIAADALRMIELEGRCLIRFLINLKHVDIPQGIESLGKSCFFDKRGILSVKFPESLKEIGSRAFRNCINLEKVSFEGKEPYIAKDAFKNCTSLKCISTQDGKEYFFTGLASLEGADIPNVVGVIQKQIMGNFRISGQTILKYLGEESRVVIPEGITRIAGEAFAGNEAVDRVILPESIQEIGAGAFRDCVLLQNIVFPVGLLRIGAGAFENCVKLIRAHLPSLISKLEERTFRHCRALREVSFPEGFEEIGDSVFYGCTAISEISFPQSLSSIGEMAFYRCSSLKEVRLGSGIRYVKSLAFAKSGVRKAWIAGCGRDYGLDVFGDCRKLKMLVLEEGMEHIPHKLAYGCMALEQVVLPGSLVSVGRQPWEGTLFLKQWLQKQHAQTGMETEETILWDGREMEGNIHISPYVKIVAGGAFYGNKKITRVYVPDSVRWIGSGAFKGCSKLQRVYLPSHIKSLEAEVFSGCSELEEVLISEERLPLWQSIGERGFYNCRKLKKIRLDYVKYMGKESLGGCFSLERCKVSNGIWLGERVFEGTCFGEDRGDGICIIGETVVSGDLCSGEICLPEGVKSIADYAFAGNRNITKITLPEGLFHIGEGAFFGCSRLADIEFQEGIKVIKTRAFEKCSSLKIVCTDALQVEAFAFAFCTALQNAELVNVNKLEDGVFEGCKMLKSCICRQAESVGKKCFCDCGKLEKFDFDHIRQVGAYAFERCDSLHQVVFQEEVSLDVYALKDCGHLEKMYVQNLLHLREYALSGCTALRQVIWGEESWELCCYKDIFSRSIPEKVRLIFSSALDCFDVEQEDRLYGYHGTGHVVKIPNGIRRIESEVFRNVTMLREVEFPESVEYIGSRAFHGTAWMEYQQSKSPMVIVRHMLLDASGCVGDVEVSKDIRLVCGWAFANGIEIESIRFLSPEVQVEEYAFRNCIFLKNIILPDGTFIELTGLQDRVRDLPPLAKQAVTDSLNCFKTDEGGVLLECTGNISKLRLAFGIQSVGESAFEDGNLLTEITFPETVKSVRKRAFAGCKWLREVHSAYGVEYIGEMAFSGCGRLKHVELSEKFQHMGARAFENCTSLEEIIIPEGVEEIPEKAFYRCHSLKNIQLPSTLKKVGKEAFAFCRNLPPLQLPEGLQVEENFKEKKTNFFGREG